MKQKVMISVGSTAVEFEGEILEFEPDYLVLRAKHGDIYIERKYLVFIQFLNEEPAPQQHPEKPVEPRTDAAAKFVSKRLKHDPLDEQFERIVPPSQFPDDDILSDPDTEIDEDMEAIKNIHGAFYGQDNPITKAANLRQAVKTAMNNDDENFSMGMGNVEYKSPAQIILGKKNESNKKS